MKPSYWIILIFTLLASIWIVMKSDEIEPRKELSMDVNWKFSESRDSLFLKQQYEAYSWETVTLPHDKSNINAGFYRRSFIQKLPEELSQIQIHAPMGANIDSLWFNGTLIEPEISSMAGSIYDVSSIFLIDSVNFIAIRTKPGIHSNFGNGLLHPLKLIATSTIHFLADDAITYSEISDSANLSVTVRVFNSERRTKKIKVRTDLLTPNGRIVSRKITSQSVRGGDTLEFVEEFYLDNTDQWILARPDLYTINARVSVRQKVTDNATVQFGIGPLSGMGTESLSSTEHFPAILDYPVTLMNRAIPIQHWQYRIELLHRLGVNLLLLPSQQMDAGILDICDQLGIHTALLVEDLQDTLGDTHPKTFPHNHPSFLGYIQPQKGSTERSMISEKRSNSTGLETPLSIWSGKDKKLTLETRTYIEVPLHTQLLDTKGDILPFGYYLQSNLISSPMIRIGVSEKGYVPAGNNRFKKAALNDQLVHHWNFAPATDTMEVVIFTNCQEVEMSLNDSLVWTSRIHQKSEGYSRTFIPYKPGKLIARGRVIQGDSTLLEVIDSLETTGTPVQIILKPDKEELLANGRDLMHIKTSITDSLGRTYPTAQNMIKYSIEGGASIRTIENGTPPVHRYANKEARPVFQGSHLLVIQTSLEPGDLIIRATSDGLKDARLRVESLPVNE